MMPTSSAVMQEQDDNSDVVAPMQPGEDGRCEPHPPPPHIRTLSPSPPPQPARAPERKDPHDLRANPKVQLAQAKRFATGVLEHYNTNKVKFELLDAKPVISIPEPRCCYTLHRKVQQGGFTGTAFLR